LKTDEKPEFSKYGTRIWRDGETGKELDGVIDANGKFHKVPAVPSGKKITVLGAKDDLYPFLNNPKYNVLDPNKDFSWQANLQFIHDAAKNGDHFIIMRNPRAWNRYAKSVYGTGSRLIGEYYELYKINVPESRIIKMYNE